MSATARDDVAQLVRLVDDPGWGSAEKFLACASPRELAAMARLLDAAARAVEAEARRR